MSETIGFPQYLLHSGITTDSSAFTIEDVWPMFRTKRAAEDFAIAIGRRDLIVFEIISPKDLKQFVTAFRTREMTAIWLDGELTENNDARWPKRFPLDRCLQLLEEQARSQTDNHQN